MQSVAIRQLQRQRVKRVLACRHEGRPQQQVLGRVAAQHQLGCHHDPRTQRRGTAGGLRDPGGVSRQVADGGIELRQHDFDDGMH